MSYFLSKVIKVIFFWVYFQVIEYFLRQLEASGYLYITKTKQVFMFMLGNALLMYLMRSRVNKEGNHDFWLV